MDGGSCVYIYLYACNVLSVHIMVGNVAREPKKIEGKDGVHQVGTTRYERLS